MIRDQIKAALVAAMKAKDSPTVTTLRMAQAAFKNRDIEARTAEAGAPANEDAMVLDVLMKMVKQRRESIEMYDKGGRLDLAANERAEIAVLEQFLPQMMSDTALQDALSALKTELGATGAQDMGRFMAAIKSRYSGQVDMAKVGPLVKALLA